MRMLIRDGDDVIDTRTLGSSVVTIGSDGDCDVTLGDRLIQPKQAVVAPTPAGGWQIEASPNGATTLLNGRPVREPMEIQHGDEIRICDYVIAIVRSQGGNEPVRTAPDTRMSQEVTKIRAHPLPPGAIIKKPHEELILNFSASSQLADYAVRLHECPDIPRLIDQVLESLLRVFSARMAYVAVRRTDQGPLEFVQGRFADSRNAPEPPMFDTYAFRCVERSQFIHLPSLTHDTIGAVLAVPFTTDRGNLGVLYVDRGQDAASFEERHMDLIVPFARLTAARLESIIARQIGVAESVSAGTLAFVREIQTRMDPASVPQWNGYQLAVYCKPGLERSGDIFDVLSLPNAFGALAVGNVEGESTPVAMDMTQMRASFRYACLHLDAPHIFMRAANWMLCEERSGCRMHCVTVVINPESGELKYCAAGNIGGVIVDRRGNAQSLTEVEVPALGAVPGAAYESQRAQLLPDETLALFSGGCCTVCSADGKPLGRERFTDSICDCYGQSATTALDELVQDLDPFFKEGRQPDDITVLLLHRAAAAS